MSRRSLIGRLRRRTPWQVAAAIGVAVLAGLPGAFSAPPTANTVIGNQASASYTDPNGVTQLATSNLVQTTVQQVGSFTLDTVNTLSPGTIINTKTGAAGATVYAPHVLTNTGNGSDTFTITVADGGTSAVAVYADVNGDGLPDSTTALCTAAAGTTCSVPAQTLAGGGVFQFVVAYSIPGSATTPTTPYDTALITATPATTALYTAPNLAASDTDHVNLTTLAAFNLTKAIGLPSVAGPGNTPYSVTASASGPRAAAAGCATTYASIAPSIACPYTVYTLNFSNTGAAAGKYAMSDVIPAGMTYVTGSAIWSNAPGVALGDGTGGDPAGIDFQATGNTINAVVTSLGVNVSQTISFVVLVNNTAAIGTSTTTNTGQYNPGDSPAATAASIGTLGSTSNPAPFTVTASYAIAVGSLTSTSVTAIDAVPGVPNATPADLTTQPSVVAGGSVKFTQTIYNNGNASDAINLTAPTSDFPAGTTFTFFAADGVTPLLDTTGDGVVDSGPIAGGSSVGIIVQANVPASATVGSGPYTVRVLGTSAAFPTAIDATNDTVTIVVGSLVDLTNTAAGTGSGSVADGDLGPGPSPLATTINTTQAGTGTLFNLFIKNNDTIANSYALTASQTPSFPGTLPTGWTVKFVALGGNCASTGITTVTVAAGTQTQVLACVTPPATQAPIVAQKIYFQAQSTAVASTGVFVRDAKTDAVTVTIIASYVATLTPDNSGQVAPGGSVVYAHTLTNTGTQACAAGTGLDGQYTLVATLSAADVAAGWTTALYIDNNGDGAIDAGDTLVTGPISGPLAAGGTQKILVKVFAPGGATAGATDVATVTATFTGAAATSCGAPDATDTSTVITGQIRVQKSQAPDIDCNGVADSAFSAVALSLKPGQCIVYEVVATNQGTAPITNISVNDAVPAYTALAATQPATQCVAAGVTGTAPAYASSASAVSCGSTANSVSPGGTVTLTFAVKIAS